MLYLPDNLSSPDEQPLHSPQPTRCTEAHKLIREILKTQEPMYAPQLATAAVTDHGIPEIIVEKGVSDAPRSLAPIVDCQPASPADVVGRPTSVRFSSQLHGPNSGLGRIASVTSTTSSTSRPSGVFDMASSAASTATLLSPVAAEFADVVSNRSSLDLKAASQETLTPSHKRTRSVSSPGRRQKLLCLGDTLGGKTALLTQVRLEFQET